MTSLKERPLQISPGDSKVLVTWTSRTSKDWSKCSSKDSRPSKRSKWMKMCLTRGIWITLYSTKRVIQKAIRWTSMIARKIWPQNLQALQFQISTSWKTSNKAIIEAKSRAKKARISSLLKETLRISLRYSTRETARFARSSHHD